MRRRGFYDTRREQVLDLVKDEDLSRKNLAIEAAEIGIMAERERCLSLIDRQVPNAVHLHDMITSVPVGKVLEIRNDRT